MIAVIRKLFRVYGSEVRTVSGPGSRAGSPRGVAIAIGSGIKGTEPLAVASGSYRTLPTRYRERFLASGRYRFRF